MVLIRSWGEKVLPRCSKMQVKLGGNTKGWVVSGFSFGLISWGHMLVICAGSEAMTPLFEKPLRCWFFVKTVL